MTSATLIATLKELHAVPGIKDAETIAMLTKRKAIRTTSTTTDPDKALKNAKRQARRRTKRLNAYLAKLQEEMVDNVLGEDPEDEATLAPVISLADDNDDQELSA